MNTEDYRNVLLSIMGLCVHRAAGTLSASEFTREIARKTVEALERCERESSAAAGLPPHEA